MSPIHDTDMSEENYIGRARVIDFMNSPRARYFVDLFNELGFQVSSTLSDNQEGNSCGYNSARVVAKLAHSNFTQSYDWLTVNVSDSRTL